MRLAGTLRFVAIGVLLCASASAQDRAARDAAFAAAAAELRVQPPPGAALGLIAHRRIHMLNFGVEALDRAEPVSADTVFQIASLTKPFTAIVMLRLAEEGRLGLDDRARDTLTWLPEAYAGVTIRQLLNHTSGVPRDLRRGNVDEFGPEEIQSRFLAATPSSAPGTRWEYSNTGYILVALIAEQRSGQPFGELLQRYIFGPLSMGATRYRAPLRDAPGRARGYDLVEGHWQAAPPVHSGFGNSGIETSARDLARFAAGLQERRLLRAESYTAMLAPARLANGGAVSFSFRGAPTSYGLGWFLTSVCDRPVALHGGTIAGFSSSLYWAPGASISAFGLANGKARADRSGIAEWPASEAFREALGCAANRPAR
jgi:D-alanyl-D-alanine carboxypeptidase